MSSLIDNPICPKCKSKRTVNHCRSRTCTWSTCKPCTSKLGSSLFVFDVKNRTMEGKA